MKIEEQKEVIKKCKESFKYFAENYLYIKTKQGLERFNPTQRDLDYIEYIEKLQKYMKNNNLRFVGFLKGRTRSSVIFEKSKI